MAQNPNDRRLPLGQAEAAPSRSGVAVEWAGAAVTLVWAVVVLVWGLGLGQASGLAGVLFLVFAVALPVVMLGFMVMLLGALRDLRREAAQLGATMTAMRAQDSRASVVRRADEPRGGDASPGFQTRRDSARSQPSADRKAALQPAPPTAQEEQPGLALATPGEIDVAPLAVDDFIRAVQFPENAEDAPGFAALRRALADRSAAKLIRAAQDVLTLLAQEGIYMDDLSPDRARPELWRRFANGERGRSVAALGGVRDRSCLALTAQRMREDPVFRDAAHHFLRSFDKSFAAVEPRCTDEDISALSDTRTARAFMLVGRVAGTFD